MYLFFREVNAIEIADKNIGLSGRKMETLQFDEFVRSLKQNKDTYHSLLLGAGTSIESGIPSATDCIWEWKREIYLSQNPELIDYYKNTKIDAVRQTIQRWLDQQNIYPENNSLEEYSYYAEKAYPIAEDRRKYFQNLIQKVNPSIGYHLICLLAEIGWIKSVWTTNFDGIMLKMAHHYDVTPIEITLESEQRIYRTDTDKELLCIALHGDYKYGELKNTEEELDSQSDIFIKALTNEIGKRNLIIIGYSGRDASLMNALKQAYSQPGAGRLYWCGYGSRCLPEVEALIDAINTAGRSAYYISTDGFDKTMLNIARHCMSEDRNFLSRIETLKQELGMDMTIGNSKFASFGGVPRKVVDTNASPIIYPKTCFQFEVKYDQDERDWDYCRGLEKNNIIAIPLKGMIYAWGDKESIIAACGEKMTSDIITVSFNPAHGAMREMLVRAIAYILAIGKGFAHKKDTIWDVNQKITRYINGKNIVAYKGVKYACIYDGRYNYVTFSPAFVYDESVKLETAERKQFADDFHFQINAGKPNLMIHNYIEGWKKSIFDTDRIKKSYPINGTSGFEFTIVRNSALIAVNGQKNREVSLPKEISKKRLVYQGTECKDPELLFYNRQQKKMVSDFHPMRGLTNNVPFDFSINREANPSISLGILCPSEHSDSFYGFLNSLNSRCGVEKNVDYVIPFPGFFSAFKTALNIPAQSDYEWIDYEAKGAESLQKSAIELGKTINRKLDTLSSGNAEVILIYIPEEYDSMTAYATEYESFDLHDFVKAYAAQKGIATQFIRERTLKSDLRCQILWALSLAIYAKSCHTPWIISDIQSDTAFAGIGYSLNPASKKSHVIVGCSHVYSSDGQGMKYKLSKINNVTFDKRNNPFLSEDEAYKLGLNIKELFHRSFKELPRRVVIHKRTPFRQEEVKGLVESLSAAGITDIELLEITYEDNLKCFEFNKDFGIHGFPIRRGLCFPLNDKTMYLYTHGIAPSVQSQYRNYIQGGKTIPIPLKVVKHYGIGTAMQIATEILGLSKMNWNSFELYSKLPCTIVSSNEIARIGWQLSQYEGRLYDYRFFM